MVNPRIYIINKIDNEETTKINIPSFNVTRHERFIITSKEHGMDTERGTLFLIVDARSIEHETYNKNTNQTKKLYQFFM